MLFFTFYFHFSCFSIPLFGIFEGFPLISFIHVLIIGISRYSYCTITLLLFYLRRQHHAGKD